MEAVGWRERSLGPCRDSATTTEHTVLSPYLVKIGAENEVVGNFLFPLTLRSILAKCQSLTISYGNTGHYKDSTSKSSCSSPSKTQLSHINATNPHITKHSIPQPKYLL